MLTNYEQFAVTSMMGQSDTPPRNNGTLCFGHEWERSAFGIAIDLAKQGVFEWEDFRQSLIAEIQHWESEHSLQDSSWDYYQLWLNALENTLLQTGIINTEELNSLAVSPKESGHAY